MKFYQDETVWDAALTRIRWLFDEFSHIRVNFSGGKDSTVVLNLALKVAEEKGRLPLEVLFIDQEAEWQSVIDYVRTVMHDPRVKPLWLQCPLLLFNATSTLDPWLHCWEPGKEWIREREPDSIHDNVFGTDRFAELFEGVQRFLHPDEPAINLAGVRTEESPGRFKGLTTYETYKGATWGKVEDKKRRHYTMYPLYDWSYTDIWKAIHDNNWPYCRLYDAMYQHGVSVPNMRVSNVHHETAVRILFILQQIEPETWNRITARLTGINTAGQMQQKFMAPTTLPPMFKDWYEYRDYLIENLVPDPATRDYYHRTFAACDARYVEDIHPDLIKMEIASVLVNDYHGTKLSTFAANNGRYSKNAGSKGGVVFGAGNQPIYERRQTDPH
jgi:predicted phosphoadenosine phosphosulfate sulfurtransferase